MVGDNILDIVQHNIVASCWGGLYSYIRVHNNKTESEYMNMGLVNI